MARGWESKSVEEQQSEKVSSSEQKPAVSPEERKKAVQAASHKMMLAKLQNDLKNARDERHRQMIEAAIADIAKKAD
jgi:hypothetical protein